MTAGVSVCDWTGPLCPAFRFLRFFGPVLARSGNRRGMASCGRVPAPLVSGVCAALRGRRSVRRAGIPIAHRLPAAGLGLNAACFSRRTEHSEGARRPTKLQAVRAEAEPSTVYVSPLPKDLYPRVRVTEHSLAWPPSSIRLLNRSRVCKMAQPAPNQQTLLRSFVVSGVGLHSGLPGALLAGHPPSKSVSFHGEGAVRLLQASFSRFMTDTVRIASYSVCVSVQRWFECDLRLPEKGGTLCTSRKVTSRMSGIRLCGVCQ